MKIEIDIDENIEDLEVIIKCAVINDKVQISLKTKSRLFFIKRKKNIILM